MFYLNVLLTVKDAIHVPLVREKLAELCLLSREEPGCERFEIYHSEADSTRFLIVEWWMQKADWETHRTAPAFTQIYIPQVLPLVERVPHPSQLIA